MIVLHAAPVGEGAVGGLQVSVPSLAAAQNGLTGVAAGLLLTVRNGRRRGQDKLPVFPFEATLGGGGRFGLPAPFDAPDLVVFHSTYIPAHAVIARRLRKAAIPYVICPRGGMTRFAQAQKRLKKLLGNLLFFRRMVAGAAAVHCLTEHEAAASRGWSRPVFVEGNGVHPPPLGGVASPGRAPCRRIVFLGRLAVRIKGLDLLLEACRLVRPEFVQRGAQLEICGPDDRGSVSHLARQVARLGLEDVVILKPAVDGQEKAALLAGADAFVHTSRSEGHPMAVLEAMAFGLPCLVTPGTNMAETLLAAGAGWVAQPTAAGIADRLVEVLRADGDRLQALGANARALALGRYGWPQVAVRTVAHYRRFAA